MTSLEQLIQRIEHQLKVSTEDALDVIQQYWDEAANTVSKYWKGTDDEIAEEVGISKQSLSEILDQHGNGQAYANLGGNSGVDSYVEGYGWIMINFTTGAKYLYTTKSTTEANIDQMKQYAHEGKGLNSYIMRICRDGYAGHNINGSIQVRPGMEQYTNEANKRLSVLYAFRNAKMSTVSNEGIFESIRKMFSSKDKDKSAEQPKFDGYIWDKAIAIEKSPPKQLNPTTQTSPIFQLNGKYNPNWVSRLEADIKQYERLTGTLKQADVKVASWAKKWRKQLAAFNGNNDKPAEFLVAARQFIKEQPTPFSEVFTNTHEYLGYGKDGWMEDDNFVYSKMFTGSRVDIPELDTTDTKKVVDIIIKLGRLILISDAEDFSYVAFDLTDAPFRGYSGNNDIDEVLNNLRYDGHSSVTPRDCYEVIEHRSEDILNALIKYVQDAQASDIGNEAICQATARKYSKLLDQAGGDGLDSVARQLMSVGLEHIKVDDVHVHPYTEVTSMEGIWDSIKDFFAGRPVKVHLSGSDRNLRSKLDRTINDRVWLSRQKYTLGEVKYRALEGFNVDTAATFVRDYVQSVTATSQHNKREMAKIRERLEAVPRALKLYLSRTMADTRLLDAAIADINPYIVRLNINLKEPELLTVQMGPQVGPALTKLEVKEFAEHIATVHATQVNFKNSIWVNPTLNYMANIQFRYGQLPQGPMIIRKAQQAMDAYTQVVMMVNREIKQRITTHAAWINAENIADSLVNYIGKSLTNVTTSSLEVFNAPLVFSNEDLIGSIKKFFTRGKDTTIYATVGKGFLQSLKSEVEKYTDLGWVKTHGQSEAKSVEINGANLIADYDEVVTKFIKDCQANRQTHHKAAEQAFKNMEEVIAMIANKKLSDSKSVENAITMMKATRQIKAPNVEVPKANPTKGVVKTLTPEEVVAKAKKLLELFNTLGADTTYVDRWNSKFINSHAWMDWKFMGKTDGKQLSEQVRNPKVVDLYQKTMEHVYDLRRIGSEFHTLQPYIMAEFQLIEKSVADT